MTKHPSNPRKILKNSDGVISVDFLFAFSMVMGFTALLFALTFTLTVSEITQYIAFASARNYSASHISIDEQINLSERKFMQLKEHPVFKPLYSNGWFEIDKQAQPKNYEGIYPEPSSGLKEMKVFNGVRISLLAKMLDFQIPFYGSTSSADRKEEGFRANLAAYLGRDPTVNECIHNFTAERWRSIRNLDNRYQANTTDNGYSEITDNGC